MSPSPTSIPRRLAPLGDWLVRDSRCGISTLDAVLFSTGIPKGRALRCEAMMTSDGCIIMAHIMADDPWLTPNRPHPRQREMSPPGGT